MRHRNLLEQFYTQSNHITTTRCGYFLGIVFRRVNLLKFYMNWRLFLYPNYVQDQCWPIAIWHTGTHSNKIFFKIKAFLFTKIRLKLLPPKCPMFEVLKNLTETAIVMILSKFPSVVASKSVKLTTSCEPMTKISSKCWHTFQCCLTASRFRCPVDSALRMSRRYCSLVASPFWKPRSASAKVGVSTNFLVLRIGRLLMKAESINMMTSSNGFIFRVADPLCGEFTGDRWIPLTKASDAEVWCFLWSAPEQTVK